MPTRTGWPFWLATLICAVIANFSRAVRKTLKVASSWRAIARLVSTSSRQAHRFPQILRLRSRRSSHPRQLFVKAEVVLERDRRVCDVLGFDIAAFFGLDRLMKPIRQPAPCHHPSGEFVNQDNLISHDVVFVLEKLVRRSLGSRGEQW